MAERKPFLLRLDAETLSALQGWAADDLRSVNGQVEFLLRRALREAGRLPGDSGPVRLPGDSGARGQGGVGSARVEPGARRVREPGDGAGGLGS